MTPARENANAREGRPSARKQAEADTRAVRAVDLRIRKSYTYQQIADELGITSQSAQDCYARGVRLLIPTEDVEEAKQIALSKLDVWEQMVLDVYHAKQYLVNFGKVVTEMVLGDDNKMHEVKVLDEGHKLAAIDRLVKIARERRAIIGYTAPSKRVLEVVTADVFDKAIEQMNAEAASLERQARIKDMDAGLEALDQERKTLSE